MKQLSPLKLIIIVLLIFLAIFLAFFLDGIFKGLALVPTIGALLTALLQEYRDNKSYNRSIRQQQIQHDFDVGTTSHMANVVFDKHVDFCEKYLEEVHQAVVTLTRHGPCKEALNHANKLYTLRIQYTAWLTQDIEEKLQTFEDALRHIGASSGFASAVLEGIQSDAYKGNDLERQRSSRSKAIDEMYNTFKTVLDFNEDEIKNEEATVKAIKEHVREILKTKELVDIRTKLISRAYDSTNK